MAGEVTESVVGGVLVEIMEGWEVKDGADDIVERLLIFDKLKTKVDDFCGKGADDVDAADFEVFFVEDDFHEAAFGSHDSSSGHVCIASFAAAVGDF